MCFRVQNFYWITSVTGNRWYFRQFCCCYLKCLFVCIVIHSVSVPWILQLVLMDFVRRNTAYQACELFIIIFIFLSNTTFVVSTVVMIQIYQLKKKEKKKLLVRLIQGLNIFVEHVVMFEKKWISFVFLLDLS